MFVFYFNSNEINAKEFSIRNKRLINLLTLNTIKECIQNNLNEKAFMKIMPENKIFIIKKHQFKKSLKKCIEYFESEEMYEECSECLNLINKL